MNLFPGSIVIVRAVAAAVLIATIAVVPALASRSGTTVVIGSTSLAANDGITAFTGQNIPVFQGDASGAYVTSSPATGVIVSWSFRSAGVKAGDRFVLRVLSPQDQSGQNWRVVATSDPVAVTSATGADSKLGPFPATIAIQKGERIALQPIDEGYTPIEQGVQGEDGIRYFSGPLSDGSSSTIAPGSGADNGQVVPIQATVQVSGAQPSLSNTSPPAISGKAAVGSTLTCSTGSWSQTPSSFAYAWLRDSGPIAGATSASYTVVAPDATHALSCKVTATAGGASTSATSASIAVPAPVLANTAAPRVVGTVKRGASVSCDPGAWTGSPTFKYTWFWQKQIPFPVFKLGLHTRLFGATKGAYYRSVFRRMVTAQAKIATGATLLVPNLPSNGDLTCAVTASSSPPTVPTVLIAQAEAVPVRATLPAQALGLDHRFHKPSIDPNVGPGSTNECQPGIWSGYPTFAYAWYKLGPKPAQRLRPRPRTLIWKGQTMKLGAFHEGLTIECVVTATNPAGSVSLGTNSYVVPVAAPQPTSGVFVAITTDGPANRDGLAGPEGASVVAEKVNLRCIEPTWSRKPDTVVAHWQGLDPEGNFRTDYDTSDALDFDMSPGKAAFQGTLRCGVVAAFRGSSTEVDSGPIWNGCVESESDGDQHPNGPSVDVTYALTAAGAAAQVASGGIFGALELGVTGVGFAPDLTSIFGTDKDPPVVYTTGPNCDDYQKYYEKQGFKVKHRDS
jgi:hypothetical protein